MEADGHTLYGSLTSDTWKRQIETQQKFAAHALESVQQLEDEETEFIMLEQVSKTNTMSFGLES